MRNVLQVLTRPEIPLAIATVCALGVAGIGTLSLLGANFEPHQHAGEASATGIVVALAAGAAGIVNLSKTRRG